MTKITLTEVGNLRNETTGVEAINDNFDTITAEFENTLSLDGTAPNSMGANLDMNTNRILNLPAAVADTEPLRLGDIGSVLSDDTFVTTFAETLLDDTTASSMRTTLGLGTMSTQAASAVAITGGTVTGITDLAVADGGTGASTAADARTNLGLGTIATQAASAVAITGGTITGITDLAVADGGTGSSTAAAARTALFGVSTTVDNAIARYDSTAGALQNSLAFVTDTGSIEVPVAANYGWTGRAVFLSPSDGVIRLSNNLGTDFGRLQFGGVTSSFPAIKRNATALDFRLADDSAPCGIIAGDIAGTTTSVTGTSTTRNATATPAAASAVSALTFGSAALTLTWGTGAPSQTQPKGSLYIRTDGTTTATRMYINTDGAGTWTNFTTAA